ncbi:MAG: OmpA family protein [Candidatus Latescibacteria bacterium]|nr:OmpA family protein [Candidatus Latescibacterota bacterium]
MVIFLFFAVSYMYDVQQNQNRVQRIAVAYRDLQTALYEDLLREFEDDLPRWKATLDRETLSIRFGEPDVLFQVGSADVASRFQDILSDFFPRYIRIIASDAYRENVEEIRIEGHTSSEWLINVTKNDAYFFNMKLSQDRTRSVLHFCLDLLSENERKIWVRSHITANGLSSSQPILIAGGVEDLARSRRVEFRTRTNAEKKVVEIIQEMEGM